MRRLEERCVRRGRQHDLRPAGLVPEPHAFPSSEAVLAGGEHREQYRLGAAAGDLPPDAVVFVLFLLLYFGGGRRGGVGGKTGGAPGENARGHGDDVSLEADRGGEDGGVLFSSFRVLVFFAAGGEKLFMRARKRSVKKEL